MRAGRPEAPPAAGARGPCRWARAAAIGVPGAAIALALAAPGLAQPFHDPFAYCAAVGTIDVPGADYAGPRMPAEVARGLQRALGLPEDAPPAPLLENATWRCMDGKVYACAFGANLPCLEKADVARSPTPAMRAFCRDDPGADGIPMVVTGRATVYAWRCEGAAPAIERQITEPDARGYLANVWYEIAGD
jgi:hypothetical protein